MSDSLEMYKRVRRAKVISGLNEVLDGLAPNWRNDENLADTPKRVAAFYNDFLNYTDDNIDSTFKGFEADQLIAATGIRVWSLCAHHLLPFSADVSIGYIANSHVIGISKLARIAHLHAHKLQLQERLVRDIADDLETKVGQSVAVTASGQHLCMTMRGIKTPAIIHSQVMRGAFLEKDATRAEFLRLTTQGGQ
jgi:GTP cyclohydrolase I